jgi:hypothetical protein
MWFRTTLRRIATIDNLPFEQFKTFAERSHSNSLLGKPRSLTTLDINTFGSCRDALVADWMTFVALDLLKRISTRHRPWSMTMTFLLLQR